MNPAELLAKVTVKAISLEPAIAGYGRFTPEDILHSLGLVKHQGAILLLRVKFCGQNEFLQDLDIRFWMAVGDMALQERWPYPIRHKGKEFYRNMGRLALAENINPNICLECGGSGIEITSSGKLLDCGPCRGSGRSYHSDRSRARLMNMPQGTWREGWDERHKQILNLADQWEDIGLSGMKKRLKSA